MNEQNNTDVIMMLKKIQEQLDLLSRKVEALANKPQERPFSPPKTFSKPYSKPFGKPFGGPSSRNDRSPREHGGFKGKESGGYGKPFEKRGEGRPFEKREEKGAFKPKFAPKYSTSFPPKKKPFFQKTGYTK